jgi:uncharacterized coiled-coil protein SlyX
MGDDRELENRVREMERMTSRMEVLLESIDKYFQKLDSNVTSAIQQIRLTDSKVEHLEKQVAVQNVRLDALSDQLKDSKKLTFKLMALMAALILASAGVKDVPDALEKMMGLPAVSKSMESAE